MMTFIIPNGQIGTKTWVGFLEPYALDYVASSFLNMKLTANMLVRTASVFLMMFLTSCVLSHRHHERRVFDVIDSLDLPPIQAVASDAIRFSTQPQLGGISTVISLSKVKYGARVNVNWLEGHPSSGWRPTGHWSFTIGAETYRKLTLLVDRPLARGEPSVQRNSDGTETLIVCSDGPGYRTERVSKGQSMVLEGNCGDDHPNNEIAKAISDLVKRRIAFD